MAFNNSNSAQLPRPFRDAYNVVAIARGQAKPDAGIDQLGMRVVTAVKFGHWLRIDVAGFRIHQRPLLEMRLEQALRAHEKRRAVVAMPIRVATWRELGAKDQHIGIRILRQRSIYRFEQNVPFVLLTGFEKSIEPQLEVAVIELHPVNPLVS
jgi:hypothetical protein